MTAPPDDLYWPFCTECGSSNGTNSPFCANCGAALAKQGGDEQPANDSEATATVPPSNSHARMFPFILVITAVAAIALGGVLLSRRASDPTQPGIDTPAPNTAKPRESPPASARSSRPDTVSGRYTGEMVSGSTYAMTMVLIEDETGAVSGRVTQELDGVSGTEKVQGRRTGTDVEMSNDGWVPGKRPPGWEGDNFILHFRKDLSAFTGHWTCPNCNNQGPFEITGERVS